MPGTWPLGWQTGDVEFASEFKKGVGCLFDTTLGSSAASVDITGIVGSYAHLMAVIYGRSDAAATLVTQSLIRFNNDSGANYDWQYLKGSSASTSANENFADSSGMLGEMPAASAPSNLFGVQRIFIPHYAGTAGNSMFVGASTDKHGTTTGLMSSFLAVGAWRSTAAITRITVRPASGNFVAGTRVSLYAMGA